MLPSKVKISGIDYDIKIAEPKSVENGVLMGEITYHEATIYINEEQNDQLKVATLLHEIVHGILYHMGSEMNDNEKFVEGFASGLHQVFRDNNWTFGGEKE
jgi:Zn-dependent peptidase ImmA (M78 family)